MLVFSSKRFIPLPTLDGSSSNVIYWTKGLDFPNLPTGPFKVLSNIEPERFTDLQTVGTAGQFKDT